MTEHIPFILTFDEPPYHELNAERCELAKRLHDGRFWALALAAHAAEQAPPPSVSIARVV